MLWAEPSPGSGWWHHLRFLCGVAEAFGWDELLAPLATRIDRWRRNQTLLRRSIRHFWDLLIDSFDAICIWFGYGFSSLKLSFQPFSLDSNINSQALQHNISMCRFLWPTNWAWVAARSFAARLGVKAIRRCVRMPPHSCSPIDHLTAKILLLMIPRVLRVPRVSRKDRKR